MAFRTNTWSWKHLAARLLLVPVLGASVAQAQSFQPNWKQPGSGPTAPVMTPPSKPATPASPGASTGGPKELLKAGRAALGEGKLDVAQDMALKAEQAAASRKYKWGMLEDTPTSLRKDVVSASAKADKAQAADLLKKAKSLYAQKAASDTERMANLDLALNMAHQSESRHGPYGMLDMDKPAGLIGDIKASQEVLRKKTGLTPGAVAKAPAIPAPVMPSGPVTQVSASMPATGAKADCLKIVAEGRSLLTQDKVVEAKLKADMAKRMADTMAFNPGDDTPDLLLTACKVKGNSMITALMADADKQMAAGAYDKADAACNMAMSLANSLGFFAKPIDEKKQLIAAKLKPGSNMVTSVPALPLPPVPAAEFLVPAPAKNIFLEKASNELKRGELEMARSLATRAFNDPKAVAADKSEAQTILRQVDAEAAARKRTEAAMAFNNAVAAYTASDFKGCHGVMVRIDPALLTPEQQARQTAFMADCTAKMNVVQASAQEDPLKAKMASMATEVKAAQTPLPVATVPTTLVSPVTPPSATVVDPAKAVVDVAFDKLRQEAIVAMKAAYEAWNKGDTDTCMKLLEEYSAKVNGTAQSPARKASLLKPIQSRLDAYALLKHNYDFELAESKKKIDNRNTVVGERIAEAQKQDEIKKKALEVKALQDQGKFKEGEALALQLRSMDPDNPFVQSLYELAKMRRRAEDNKRFKDENEAFVFEGLNGAERQGTFLDTNNPLEVNPERARLAAERGDGMLQTTSRQDQKIEGELSTKYPLLKFENMPLKDVIEQIKKSSKVNITIDYPTLEDEKLSIDSVVINETFTDLSLNSALKVLLEKARLVYVVEDGVVKITTPKRSKGRMKTKVFPVMDLVTPIPEYKLSPHQTLGGAIEAGKGIPPAVAGMGGITPLAPRTMPGELISGGAGSTGSGNQLVSGHSVGGPGAMLPQRVQYAEQLKKLITLLVNSQAWADNNLGGSGTIAYYDIGGAMVVNQTADIITEVEALLNSLRRLQDLSVAVEIRVISLSETYFERIGVDFSANITTNNASFERSLTTGSFRPEPFINRIDTNGTTVGYSPATGFTSDLGIPIRPSSYNLTAPPFGGYQNSLSPTLNGGLSLGLAFLNDIQVYMFLEAAAGNRRINIMQAPKITLFNGQTSTVFVGDLAYFATGLQVYSANGQFVYLPVNQAFPIGQGFNPNGTGTGTSNGVSVTVQAIISADRRFVRLNLTPSLTALASATVPLYPITTFITPVFEGGSQGQPIPFTQFFQQPSFTEVSAQTTVAIPDGGTVLLGGLKTMAQGRNEFGPPVLSNVPYLNRLFKNVGIGSETRHVMLMVTPRIIINSEEEARQTGGNTGNPGSN